MRLRRVGAIVLRQGYLLRGSLPRLLPIFAWSAIDIVLWGFLTRYLNVLAPGRVDFVPLLLGAILLWDFLSRVMHGVASAFLEDVWTRNFVNLFATPLQVGEYVLGMVLTSLLTGAAALAIMLVLAVAVFGLSILIYGWAFAAFLLVLLLLGVALGILACALVLRFGPAAEWMVWPLPALLSPFAGVLYPVATLPGWMRLVARALPASYVFEGMRAVVAGGPAPVAELGAGTALAVVYIAAAALVYRRVHRRAVRTGLLVRYSAETAG